MAYLDEQIQKIKDLNDGVKKQRLGELVNQKDQAVTDLRRQLSDQLPAYQTARAQADVMETQNLNKLKEYMANNGAFSSGDNLSRGSNVLTQKTNTINQVNGNENAFTSGITNKIADANTAYNNNVNSVTQSIDNETASSIEALRDKVRQEEIQKQQQELAYQRQLEQQAAERAWQEQQAQKQFERQLQMQREQQAASLKAASVKSSSSNSSSTKAAAAQKQKDTDAVWSELYNNIDRRTAEGFLQSNRNAIIANLGTSEYNKMLNYVKDYTYSAAENKQYTQRTNNRRPDTYMGD